MAAGRGHRSGPDAGPGPDAQPGSGHLTCPGSSPSTSSTCRAPTSPGTSATTATCSAPRSSSRSRPSGRASPGEAHRGRSSSCSRRHLEGEAPVVLHRVADLDATVVGAPGTRSRGRGGIRFPAWAGGRAGDAGRPEARLLRAHPARGRRAAPGTDGLRAGSASGQLSADPLDHRVGELGRACMALQVRGADAGRRPSRTPPS